MRKDKRKFSIEYIEGDFHLCYNGKKCAFEAGRMDEYEVFRYGNDFFILSWNRNLEYAGFSLISEDCELIQDLFFQDAQEVFESVTGKTKKFFNYTPNYQADFFAQWIQ